MADDLHVDGLTEAIKALRAFDKELGDEARDLMKGETIRVQRRAQGRLGAGGGNYPNRRGMIGRSTTLKGAAIKLAVKRYPWARGAEYGAKRAWVWGRVTTQAKLRRRQFAVWRGNQFVTRGRSGPGWVIQPAIRELLPSITRNLANGLEDVMQRAFRRAGI